MSAPKSRHHETRAENRLQRGRESWACGRGGFSARARMIPASVGRRVPADAIASSASKRPSGNLNRNWDTPFNALYDSDPTKRGRADTGMGPAGLMTAGSTTLNGNASRAISSVPDNTITMTARKRRLPGDGGDTAINPRDPDHRRPRATASRGCVAGANQPGRFTFCGLRLKRVQRSTGRRHFRTMTIPAVSRAGTHGVRGASRPKTRKKFELRSVVAVSGVQGKCVARRRGWNMSVSTLARVLNKAGEMKGTVGLGQSASNNHRQPWAATPAPPCRIRYVYSSSQADRFKSVTVKLDNVAAARGQLHAGVGTTPVGGNNWTRGHVFATRSKLAALGETGASAPVFSSICAVRDGCRGARADAQ